MLGSILVYAGSVASLLGLASLLRPSKRVGIRTRKKALGVLAAGLLLGAFGFLLPAAETQATSARTRLDWFAPRYQFNEVHRIHIAAPAERVFRAIKEVTAEEILFFRTLTRIRRLGRPGPEGILNAPQSKPLLDVATRTTFLLLAEVPGKELVIGTVVLSPPGTGISGRRDPEAFRALARPGFAKAAMNFLLEPDDAGGCVLITETRVFASDAFSKRRFATYWRIIYPGSSLIRSMWLRAIKRRAEQG